MALKYKRRLLDHLQHKIKVVSHFRLDGNIEASYQEAASRIEELVGRLEKPLAVKAAGSGLIMIHTTCFCCKGWVGDFGRYPTSWIKDWTLMHR